MKSPSQDEGPLSINELEKLFHLALIIPNGDSELSDKKALEELKRRYTQAELVEFENLITKYSEILQKCLEKLRSEEKAN